MSWIKPIILRLNGIRLEPLEITHEKDLRQATADGALWQIPFAAIPEENAVADYIHTALAQRAQAQRLAFAVIDENRQTAIGSSSYYQIQPEVQRLEIGYTWYAQSHWRSHVNTHCKLMLLTHAFETLQARVVGLRTDCLNIRSQQAILRLGARQDGMIRGDKLRHDGSIRDSVLYSISQEEWPAVKSRLQNKAKPRER